MNIEEYLPENFDKLKHVPVFAVRNLLIDLLPDQSGLQSKSGEELITLVAQTPQVTSDVIEMLFEEYRYGSRASFFLYLLNESESLDNIPDLKSLQAELATLLFEESSEKLLAYHIDICDTESLQQGLMEIRYKYRTIHEFIDPNNEMPASIAELHFGFMWLNLKNNYLVLMSKYEEINRVIERLITRLTGFPPSPVRLVPHFVNQQFHLEDIRSASWQEPRSGLRRRISGENLYDTVSDEIHLHDHQAERTSSLYSEYIDDEITSRLGITLHKGKLYLTRTIRASLLRQWMYTRLHPLLLALQNLPLSDLIQMNAVRLPDLGLSEKGNNYFRHIISGVLTKQQDRAAVVLMPNTDIAIHASLKRLFNEPEAFFFCEQCDESSLVHCSQCGSNDLVFTEYGFRCRKCENKQLVEPGIEISCLRDHVIECSFSDIEFVLRPNYLLQNAVATLIQSETNVGFNPLEEFFWIEGGYLNYIQNSAKTVYLPTDVTEFQQLPQEEITDELWRTAYKILALTKEKCTVASYGRNGQPHKEDCEECFEHNLGRLCIPKLFRILDRTFMPLPHGGYEFGDVGLTIRISGEVSTFVGIAKSGTNPKPIEFQEKQGQEILRQVVRQVLRDQRVESFGIITTRYLTQELRATIVMLAKMARKRVIFWGYDDLVQLCAAMLLDQEHENLWDLVENRRRTSRSASV